jgi:hypothetical protein
MMVASDFLFTQGRPETCTWAIAPLVPAWPNWIEPAAARWTCRREARTPTFVTTGECRECSRWQPRPANPEHPRR